MKYFPCTLQAVTNGIVPGKNHMDITNIGEPNPAWIQDRVNNLLLRHNLALNKPQQSAHRGDLLIKAPDSRQNSHSDLFVRMRRGGCSCSCWLRIRSDETPILGSPSNLHYFLLAPVNSHMLSSTVESPKNIALDKQVRLCQPLA
jgi:hypothetical protein